MATEPPHFNSEDGGSLFFWIIAIYVQGGMVSQFRKLQSEKSLPWKPENVMKCLIYKLVCLCLHSIWIDQWSKSVYPSRSS
jgi:hypothetical protein